MHLKRENIRKHRRDVLLGMVPDVDRRPLIYAKEAALVTVVIYFITKRGTVNEFYIK